jgi:death-on-curing protein
MTRYLNLNEVLEMHRILINRYGGALGVRDLNGLESALYRPQTGYYADIIAEASALMESIVINHPFIDGNKRVAFAVTDVFLRINGFKIIEKPMRIHEKMIRLFENYQFYFIHVEAMLREIVKPHKQ